MIVSIAPPMALPVAVVQATCGLPGKPSEAETAPPLWLASTQALSPKVALSSPVADHRLEIWRAPDGLFYVDGAINGEPVRFVVDTGASMVVLTASDARRANVTPAGDGGAVDAETVGGRRTLDRVILASMQVGGTGVTAAPAVVAREGLSVSLLGQSWLSHLASVMIEGDRMILQ
ncbi:TIGR02281 family clan AA aspartic protease [Sphingomonas sp.]|uniref:retropepsin-like aspartic protease family protein n=1 Tax=Sphingomonas sp. TaxID=28214 RepID=UPI0025DF4B72|nr:TIGR02281 family clan AA aspartic protease [Sphingomonas sp.]